VSYQLASSASSWGLTKVLCPRGTVDGLTISASVILAVIARMAMALLN
jgi:hypothetical protein